MHVRQNTSVILPFGSLNNVFLINIIYFNVVKFINLTILKFKSIASAFSVSFEKCLPSGN